MSKEVILDRVASISPGIGYLGIYVAGVSIQDFVAILTGVLVFGQIVKLSLDLRDRWRAKRPKELPCPSNND